MQDFQPFGDKSTWGAKAKAIVALGYPAVSNQLADILVWLQDMNWPGSRTIADFLVSIGEPVVPYVKEVLAGKDGGWKLNLLTQVASRWPKELVTQIEAELMHYVMFLFSTDELDIEALRLLTKHNLGDEEVIRREIARKRSLYQWHLSELKEIEDNWSPP